MGEEGCENLEALVKEKTGEEVEADVDWTVFKGTVTIDACLYAGFLFQSDAGSEFSIEVTEYGNRAVPISRDEEPNSLMYLVIMLRRQKWTTIGNLRLRFMRRVRFPEPLSFARLRLPPARTFASPSHSYLGNAEAPESSTANAAGAVTGEQRVANWVASINSSRVPQQTPSRGSSEDTLVAPLDRQPWTPSRGSSEDSFVAPLDRQPWTPEDVGETTEHGDTMEHRDTTDQEDSLTISTATLRG